ncbi:MAG: hypothetical protein E7368_04400 [Clostridiales bacterium]|nr:hypothetical protein [Clostridiales bacterium]
MRADKVILRTILTTFLSVVVLFGTMLLMLYLFFPGTLMGITYDLGMEESSMNNARRAYNRTDDVYYIATAFETATEVEDVERIEEYGQLLIKDNEFADYCELRNGKIDKNEISITYEQYVYGQVVMSQYSQGKKGLAIDTAFHCLEGELVKNDPMAILYLTAIQVKDVETITAIEKLITENNLAESQHWKELSALKNNQ